MYRHVKKLMYTVRVGDAGPRFGNMLLEQFGGANGELAAAMHKRLASKISNGRLITDLFQ
jgi:Mn-containing catalase